MPRIKKYDDDGSGVSIFIKGNYVYEIIRKDCNSLADDVVWYIDNYIDKISECDRTESLKQNEMSIYKNDGTYTVSIGTDFQYSSSCKSEISDKVCEFIKQQSVDRFPRVIEEETDNDD